MVVVSPHDKADEARVQETRRDRGFWHNETTATHQDFAGVFVAKAVERYLKRGGKLAFVVPNPVIDRDYWSGFRRGEFDGVSVRFSLPWDLRRVRPHLFPRVSSTLRFGVGNLLHRMPSQCIANVRRIALFSSEPTAQTSFESAALTPAR